MMVFLLSHLLFQTRQDEQFEPRYKMKGRSSSRKRHLRKKGVEGERKVNTKE